MALDFRRATINFDPTRGRTQDESVTVAFGGTVRRADVALNGFDIAYTNGDHHILREKIDARVVSVLGNTVTVGVEFLLRDSSGNIDDPFTGRVDVLVMADVP